MSRKKRKLARVKMERINVMFHPDALDKLETALHYLSLKTGIMPAKSAFIREAAMARTNKTIDDYRKHRQVTHAVTSIDPTLGLVRDLYVDDSE